MPGNVTFNFTTTNSTVLSRAQVAQQASYSQPPSMTCGDSNAQAVLSQQIYPNQQPSNAQVALPQSAYESIRPDRQSLYQRPTTYEAHWPTSTGAMNASYNASVGSYLGAAAAGQAMQQATAVEGYEKARMAERARQGAAYAK